jgi:hypothetical protein
LSGNSNSTEYSIQELCLNLSARSNGDIISLSCNSGDRPNRFHARANGGDITSTGWLGCTTEAGPWDNYSGAGICNGGAATITFVYNSSVTYSFYVEIGNSMTLNDSWTANLSCNTPVAPTPAPVVNYVGSEVYSCDSSNSEKYFVYNFLDNGEYFKSDDGPCYYSTGPVNSYQAGMTILTGQSNRCTC